VTEPVYEVAIIGAGPGGIAAAHLLRKKGITDFVILERADDFGGTWRDNHYPGLAVDIPSLWYQLSFNPNPEWSRLFAPGPELYRYFQDTARQLGLYAHLRTNSEVVQQKWDDASGIWRLEVRDQPSVTARFVISSVGGYINAKAKVDIDGIDDFEGAVLRPNAWDDDYDPRGKRIAVIGTGSSGVQIAAALSEQAKSLDVYQRTPGWVLPKIDFEFSPLARKVLRLPGFIAAVNMLGRVLMDAFMVVPIVHLLPRLPDRILARLLPLYDKWSRLLYRGLLRATVDDPAYRKALVPRMGILAKRPVISSAFFKALNNPNTALITTAIERITRNGVRTADGVEREADLIVAVDRSRDLPARNDLERQRLRPRPLLPRTRDAQLCGHCASAPAQPVGDRRTDRLRRLRVDGLRRDNGRTRGTDDRRGPPPRCSRRRGQPRRVQPLERADAS